MAIDSISNESIDALIESACNLQTVTSGTFFTTKSIDLIQNYAERDLSWPQAYSALREVASKIEILLLEMGWNAKLLNPIIERTLEAKPLNVYAFKHSQELISKPALIVEHLTHQLEKGKPLSTSLLCTLLFIAYKADTYLKHWTASVLHPPSTPEKAAAIHAYRAGYSLNKIIELSQRGADSRSTIFKETLGNELAVFSKELTLLYQSLFNLTKAAPSTFV